MELANFWRKITVAQANGLGILGLSRTLMNEINRPVIITDARGHVLSWHCPPSVALFPEERIPLPSTIRDRREAQSTGIITIKGKKFKYYCWPVGEARALGYLLVLEKIEEAPETEELPVFGQFAEAVSLAIMVEIMHQREIAAREKNYKDEFVRDLIFNNFDGIDEVIQSGKIWGCDFSGAHIVMVIESLRKNDDQETDYLTASLSVEKFFSEKAPGSIVGEMAHSQVVILPLSKTEPYNWHSYVRDLFAALAAVSAEWKFIAGIGKFYESLNMLYRSYQQAKVALELCRIVQHEPPAFFDELGAVRLFYNQSEQDLDEFYKEVIGTLEQFDRENNGNLVTTLWQYLRGGRDLKHVSEKLFIHANTLRYRLKKIEELLGASLENDETRFNVYAALKVAAILGKFEME